MSKEKRTAVSVFLIALAIGLNVTGLSPILGVLDEKYQKYGTSMVQLLHTLPYFMATIGSLIVGWWTTKMSKKKIVLLGLLIVGACGIFPFFSDSFYCLLISRFLIGFGYGIVSPLNAAIIAEVFEEHERAGYIGLHVVGMGIGTMIGNLAGGILADWGYQYFYFVHLIAFVSLIFVQLLLQETAPAKKMAQGTRKLNNIVYGISFASFAHTLFINAYSTNIGIYILQNITKDTTITGVVTAVNAVFALLMGVIFAKISKVLQKYTISASIFAAALGYGAILVLPEMAGVYIGSALCGISLSCFMAGCSTLITISVEPDAVAMASGFFSVIGSLGGLFAPIFMGNAATIAIGENTAENQFMIALIGMLVLGTIVYLVMRKLKNVYK